MKRSAMTIKKQRRYQLLISKSVFRSKPQHISPLSWVRKFTFVQASTDELLEQTAKPESLGDVVILNPLPTEKVHSHEKRRVVAAKWFVGE